MSHTLGTEHPQVGLCLPANQAGPDDEELEHFTISARRCGARHPDMITYAPGWSLGCTRAKDHDGRHSITELVSHQDRSVSDRLAAIKRHAAYGFKRETKWIALCVWPCKRMHWELEE